MNDYAVFLALNIINILVIDNKVLVLQIRGEYNEAREEEISIEEIGQ
jgi:hypothetical protein